MKEIECGLYGVTVYKHKDGSYQVQTADGPDDHCVDIDETLKLIRDIREDSDA